MKSKHTLLWLHFVLVTSFLTGCTSSGEAVSPGDDLLQAVATTGMIGDAVKNVSGDRLETTTLMGPGVDPHLYKASAGDVRTLSDADVIFYNGLHLEAAMGDVLGEMGARRRTVPVAEAIPPSKLISPHEYEGQYDPHVWFDVSLWQYAVERIRDVLIEMDPEGEEAYRFNAEAYLQQLVELDGYVTSQARRVSERKRVLITAHDAFNYFGRRYGFEVRGLQGISTATEAGAADIQQLADFIARRQISAVFVETSVPVRNIEAVQAAVQSRGFEVVIGSELFSDAMGDPGTVEGTYIGMLRHNIDVIVAGLLGEDGVR